MARRRRSPKVAPPGADDIHNEVMAWYRAFLLSDDFARLRRHEQRLTPLAGERFCRHLRVLPAGVDDVSRFIAQFPEDVVVDEAKGFMAGVFCWLRFLCREVIADGHLVRRQLTEQAEAAAVVVLQESRLSGTQRMVQVALECGVAPDDLDGMVECLLGLGYDRDYVVVMMPPYPFAWNGTCHWMYDWNEFVL